MNLCRKYIFMLIARADHAQLFSPECVRIRIYPPRGASKLLYVNGLFSFSNGTAHRPQASARENIDFPLCCLHFAAEIHLY